ncbi:MAG: hypothetical protein ACYDHW_02305 [Syntrophorhabdaceae bacterium]
MILKLYLLLFLIGSALIGCATWDTQPDEGSPSSGPTASDMMNILDDETATRPYSRYAYKVIERDGSETASGMVGMSQTDAHDLWLLPSGTQLKIVASESFRQALNLQLGNSDHVPFGGGYVAGGRLAIMPGLYKPLEFLPYWFPANADVSIDNRCNFLIRMKKVRENETQNLVAFMDAKSTLDHARCEILGTFHTIPQLKKLVMDLRRKEKYYGKSHYVLRLSWGPTFALVRIAREGER